jgi:hypothetical protein
MSRAAPVFTRYRLTDEVRFRAAADATAAGFVRGAGLDETTAVFLETGCLLRAEALEVACFFERATVRLAGVAARLAMGTTRKSLLRLTISEVDAPYRAAIVPAESPSIIR